MEVKELIVEQNNLRIDKFLTSTFTSYSRCYFQYLIKNKLVFINNVPIKKKDQPKKGDVIKIFFKSVDPIALKAQNIDLNIIYEDDDILVINKSPNLVVHPGAGNKENTFVNALLYHCNIEINDDLRPGIVHRLDKETSGVLIAAKNNFSHQHLIKQFANRSIEKTYLAICKNIPKDQMLSAPIKRHKINRKQMTVTKEGKTAISNIKVLCSNKNFSLVQINPLTGRTHQIRVHLKYLNCPIVGDSLYSHDKNATRQMLHAYKLSCIHPKTKKKLTFKAPLWEDFKKNLTTLDLMRNFVLA